MLYTNKKCPLIVHLFKCCIFCYFSYFFKVFFINLNLTIFVFIARQVWQNLLLLQTTKSHAKYLSIIICHYCKRAMGYWIESESSTLFEPAGERAHEKTHFINGHIPHINKACIIWSIKWESEREMGTTSSAARLFFIGWCIHRCM